MIKVISLSFIPGFMVGFEWDYINGTVVLDLGIVRLMYDYVGYDASEIQKESAADKKE